MGPKRNVRIGAAVLLAMLCLLPGSLRAGEGTGLEATTTEGGSEATVAPESTKAELATPEMAGEKPLRDASSGGSEPLTVASLRELTGPYLTDLRAKLPRLAAELEQGFGKKWSLEALADGCRGEIAWKDGEQLRACQNKGSVRLERAFFASKKEQLSAGVLHELAAGIRLRQRAKGEKDIAPAAVAEMVAMIRDPKSTPAALQKFAAKAGFGNYLTVNERKEYRQSKLIVERKLCDGKGSEAEYQLHLSKLRDFKADLIGPVPEMFEIEDAIKAEVRKRPCVSPWRPLAP